MNVLTIKELRSHNFDNALYFPRVLLSNSEVTQLITSCNEFSGLVPIINKIYNQGITRIGSIREYGQTYERKGEILSFSDFSTAELLFVVAYAAVTLKIEIIIQWDIYQLEKDVLKLFYTEFVDNKPYIKIVVESREYKNWLLNVVR